MKLPLTEAQKMVFDSLLEIAREGRECPSDLALERRFGRRVNARDVMASLQRKGYIEIDRYGYKRVIRFPESGESTALPEGAAVAGAGFTMGGDPCWYCGTRPDADPAFKCRSCR